MELCARLGVARVFVGFKVLAAFLPVEPGQAAADERQHEQKQQRAQHCGHYNGLDARP